MDQAKLRDGLRKEGLYVAEGDPVLELVAICEVALADTVATIERVTKQQADRITSASAQVVTQARMAANAIVNEAGEWAETRIKTAGEAAAASVLAVLQQETGKAERASRAAAKALLLTGIMAAVVLSGLAGMLLAVIR
jgi:hypothetical protein